MISKKKFRFFNRKYAGFFLRLSGVLCVISMFYLWTNEPSRIHKNTHSTIRDPKIFPLIRNAQEFTGEERRIARHFALDTLPGLMQRGLIVKLERRHDGTLLHVAGKLW